MSRFILSAFADEIADSLQTQMDVLEQHGINHIEMRGVNGRPLVDHTLREVAELKKQLDARGFKISAVGSPIGKIDIEGDFIAHLELFRHTVEIAKLLDAPYIRMFSFFIPKDRNPAEFRQEVLARWSQFIRIAEGTGLVLLHENEKEIYGDTAERCLDLMESLNCDFLKATFDPANFVQCHVKTYPEAYEMLRPHVAYVHIKDALYSDGSVVPAGYGDGCVREILTELRRSGFDGFASVEPHLGSFTGFAALEGEPGERIRSMPEGGPKLFAVAVEAFKKILAETEESDRA